MQRLRSVLQRFTKQLWMTLVFSVMEVSGFLFFFLSISSVTPFLENRKAGESAADPHSQSTKEGLVRELRLSAAQSHYNPASPRPVSLFNSQKNTTIKILIMSSDGRCHHNPPSSAPLSQREMLSPAYRLILTFAIFRGGQMKRQTPCMHLSVRL